MADYKRIIKNILFVALVPSVITASYYGYKAYKSYKNKKDEDKEEKEKDSEPTYAMPPIKNESKVKKAIKIKIIFVGTSSLYK